ncbi:MAG: hypothetical protein Q9P14_05110 [candidate division KSB1 bacterium]|nr:hypothetical protein [candidate division KSB1 bacterium]MDQ7064731.1 hypothetical protein [candidate division KSB1 bacterium]
MSFFKLSLIFVLLALCACAAPRNGEQATGGRDRNLISLAEIQSSHASNAYDLIRELRPHWLRGRGQKSIKFASVAYPVVYVNGNRHGSVQSLYNLTTDNITEIQFLDPGDATVRFGANHPSGAILVTMFY